MRNLRLLRILSGRSIEGRRRRCMVRRLMEGGGGFEQEWMQVGAVGWEKKETEIQRRRVCEHCMHTCSDKRAVRLFDYSIETRDFDCILHTSTRSLTPTTFSDSAAQCRDAHQVAPQSSMPKAKSSSSRSIIQTPLTSDIHEIPSIPTVLSKSTLYRLEVSIPPSSTIVQ